MRDATPMLKELLAEYEIAVRKVFTPRFPNAGRDAENEARYIAARQAIEERDSRQEEALVMFREEQARDKAEIESLRARELLGRWREIALRAIAGVSPETFVLPPGMEVREAEPIVVDDRWLGRGET